MGSQASQDFQPGAKEISVFISWSGPISRRIAEGLHEWIPTVLPYAAPWMSSQIQKGAEWLTEILGHLDAADFGIVCLTTENCSSSWLHFEAGAMVRRLSQRPAAEGRAHSSRRLAPLLFQVEPPAPPIGLFQATRAEEADTLKLMEDINELATLGRLERSALHARFGLQWPKLATYLASLVEESRMSQVRRIARELAGEDERRVIATGIFRILGSRGGAAFPEDVAKALGIELDAALRFLDALVAQGSLGRRDEGVRTPRLWYFLKLSEHPPALSPG